MSSSSWLEMIGNTVPLPSFVSYAPDALSMEVEAEIKSKLTGGFDVRLLVSLDAKIVKNVDDVLENDFQPAVYIDLSVLDGFNVLDEVGVVGFDGLDLLIGQTKCRSKSIEQSV